MDTEFAGGPHDTMHFEEEARGTALEGCVPDFAERRETLRRANGALIRARELLERVKRLEKSES